MIRHLTFEEVLELHRLALAQYDDEHRFTMVRRYPYSLVYRVLPDGVYVVAVVHSRRRPGYWRRRS